MPCSAWGDLHLLTSDPASNSHLSEVLYLRTLKANIVFFHLYTQLSLQGRQNDNIKPCWKQDTRRKWSSICVIKKKNQQKEGYQYRIKKEKLCAFCAVHLSVMLFIVTALKEEVKIRASQAWTALHSKNMPALFKQHLLKALAMF